MKDFYSFDELSMPYMIRVLFWGLYLVVFAYAVWKMVVSTTKNKKLTEVTGLFVIFFALYAVFYCINPDYFRYRDWIYNRDFDLWNKEGIYISIVYFCRTLSVSYPYEVFRLIIWGGAVIIAYYTFRMYRGLLLPGLAVLLLFVFHAGTFCYARASLAMAIYFFGIAIFLLHDRKILKLLGIGLALSSLFFHREMLIGIAILPCLFIPFERKKFTILSAILLLLAVLAISFFSSNLEFLDQMFDNEDISSKMEIYDEKGQGEFRLSTLINYLKYFFPFYLITKYFWKNKIPNSVVGMYRISYGILMASIAFMLVYGLRSIYTYRIMYISMIPMTALIGYGYSRGYFTKKQFLLMMLIALLTNSVRFVNAQ